jgi:hypothetical protein
MPFTKKELIQQADRVDFAHVVAFIPCWGAIEMIHSAPRLVLSVARCGVPCPHGRCSLLQAMPVRCPTMDRVANPWSLEVNPSKVLYYLQARRPPRQSRCNAFNYRSACRQNRYGMRVCCMRYTKCNHERDTQKCAVLAFCTAKNIFLDHWYTCLIFKRPSITQPIGTQWINTLPSIHHFLHSRIWTKISLTQIHMLSYAVQISGVSAPECQNAAPVVSN